MKLEEYDYTIEYIQGKENKAADCLSRVQPIQEKTDYQTEKTSDVPSVSEHTSNMTDKNSESKVPNKPEMNIEEIAGISSDFEEINPPTPPVPEKPTSTDWEPSIVNKYYQWLRDRKEDFTKYKPNADGKLWSKITKTRDNPKGLRLPAYDERIWISKLNELCESILSKGLKV